MIRILQSELNSPTKFKEKLKDFIIELQKYSLQKHNINFAFDEIGDLLLSASRANEFNILEKKSNKKFLNENLVFDWLEQKIIPITIISKLDDEDIIRLLIFCIEITYQMFLGGTKATTTQKGFRQRRRSFESILADQFVGKLGEVLLKKFLEKNFPVNIQLDWEISTEIEKFRNDIINADKKVSIKTSPTLAGIWAEADLGYDYGVMVKCFVPHPPILQFFIEACGFTKLINFLQDKIPPNNGIFQGYLTEIKTRIKDYKCGEAKTEIKGFICGYFKTKANQIKYLGENLKYMGEIREERYIVPITELKWQLKDWEKFLYQVKLIKN